MHVHLPNDLGLDHLDPALFVGLTAGARGREIVMTIPGRTPCYRCATSIRHARDEGATIARDKDYGTGRLDGVVALGVDVQHVTGVAVKLALSLALEGEEDAALADLAPSILRTGISYLTSAMSEGYWFYPGFFGGLGGQFGYQSVGLAVDPDPACAICGPDAELQLVDEETPADLASLRRSCSRTFRPQAEAVRRRASRVSGLSANSGVLGASLLRSNHN